MSNLDHKIKTAAGKVPLDLLPLRALFGPSRAFQHGTIKYEIGNYLRATDDSATANRYGGAALRHLADMQGLDGVFARPDAIDDESGLPHLDHLIATLLMLRSILIQSGRLPADPGPSRFVRGEPVRRRMQTIEEVREGHRRDLDALAQFAARESAPSLANVLAERKIKARAREAQAVAVAVGHREMPSRFVPLADLAGLAARDQFLDPDPDITSDSWWQRHPLGSPERVQAVEEHRAACEARR